MKFCHLLNLVVLSAVTANQINTNAAPTAISELNESEFNSRAELNSNAKPEDPDYKGYLSKAKEDPIGFVSWKYDTPVPDPYGPVLRPLIKAGVNNAKGKIAKHINKGVKAIRTEHKEIIKQAADDFGDFFEGKEQKLEKIFAIATAHVNKDKEFFKYWQALQIFFEATFTGEIADLTADFISEVLRHNPKCGRTLFNGFVNLQAETKLNHVPVYKTYVAKIKKAYK
ncbi:hypothetical protein K502DRAFT_355920 [Neoconidiobolus thromboides FSU 785]|nr:hypothetical protein K502DRAFT_355920 [Neoconidiobolus thromboides FSU 785]